jgi:hypothetical protein
MKWAGNIVRMAKTRNVYIILVRTPEGRDHLEYLGTDGIILEMILGKQLGKVWTGCY